MARGRFLARQDADDVSLPGRLRAQASCLASEPGVVLVSCWTRFVGPEGEELFVVRRHEDPAEARRLLRARTVDRVRGLSGHGSAMMRRADYEHAGGYREAFWVAQDLDLWLRLTDRSDSGIRFLPQVLYEARFSPASLSMDHHREQLALARIALDLTEARSTGGDETALLAAAAAIRPPSRRSTRVSPAGDYFIGKSLLARRDGRAQRYLARVVRRRPWHLQAWAGLVLSVLFGLLPPRASGR
jgi:hypothetical protein